MGDGTGQGVFEGSTYGDAVGVDDDAVEVGGGLRELGQLLLVQHVPCPAMEREYHGIGHVWIVRLGYVDTILAWTGATCAVDGEVLRDAWSDELWQWLPASLTTLSRLASYTRS